VVTVEVSELAAPNLEGELTELAVVDRHAGPRAHFGCDLLTEWSVVHGVLLFFLRLPVDRIHPMT
jgi:hypothetical protein